MTDPQTMPAGEELDAIVAERIFGIEVLWDESQPGLRYPFYREDQWPKLGTRDVLLPEYSGDTTTAFSLIPPDTYFSLTYHAGKWVAQIGTAQAIGEGETAEVAICRAALKRAEEQAK